MAYIAACTDKGAKRKNNQDACCVQVADTPFGEMVMGVVCDGVGGLSAGELASATVAYRFAQWFRAELPTLLAGMDSSQPLDFDIIQTVWGVMLTSLNEMIQAYGRARGQMLGTTFTGILLCGGQYVVGHVGDCRLYQIGPRGVRQVTRDQTLLQKKLDAGELTPEEAAHFEQGHVILQSVGTEGLLKPEFYQGACSEADLFVICCDGAYRKAADAGIETFFEGVDHTDESALGEACRKVLTYDLSQGEKDNLTIVCISADTSSPAGDGTDERAGQQASTKLDAPSWAYAAAYDGDDGPITHLQDDDEDDPITMVQDDDDADLPTMVEAQNEEDLPTAVDPAGSQHIDPAEEDLPTMVEGDEE